MNTLLSIWRLAAPGVFSGLKHQGIAVMQLIFLFLLAKTLAWGFGGDWKGYLIIMFAVDVYADLSLLKERQKKFWWFG
jgi:hypothetical protein